ncbi:hypothetical protein HED48_22470 [Ochrobactrum intermedium]|nr:hypothetical protein [Brucella intermedia]
MGVVIRDRLRADIARRSSGELRAVIVSIRRSPAQRAGTGGRCGTPQMRRACTIPGGARQT